MTDSCENPAKFCKILQNLEKSLNFDEILKKSAKIEFAAVQRNVDLIDLEKP